ncbi:HBL024Cp [Eremothecium sinecaudum]|uniref:HBL024Cp n=1 Tax=Eremothecium sinecaudum TaxID=45286 RepID=A0A109UWP8_9SACH|nr:HBL024Cp [Eremothecium sinecaudum]AMD18878.1 HBL024Cp [Eremothecium sinecaudum]
MSVKPIDTFISNSLQLLSANPSQTSISFTYKNKNVDDKQYSHVTFKTRNSHLGLNCKFRTKKSKDVSRLLSALGPRGVNIVTSSIEKKKIKQKSKDVVGMATLLVNTEVKEYIPESATVGGGSSSTVNNVKSKKSKKKGKKR